MSTETLEGNLSLVMDSVKLLHLGDTLSYVISIRPQTPRATVFQNLTIQVVKEKTTAFLSTYYPSKEWIDRWRAGHAIAFKDNTIFNKINLNDVGLDTKTLSTTNFKQENGLKGKIIASISSPSGVPNIISLAPGECEIYDIYTVVPHTCSTGDWPGTCPWEVGGIPEEGGFLPYYSLERTTGVDCAPPAAGTEGGGGSGGGSTVPTPPPTYNPCDGGTPNVSFYFERGTRLAVLPPTSCDPIMPEGADPSISSNAQYLFNILPISDDSRKQYIKNHNEATNTFVAYLTTNGPTTENKNFVIWAISYLIGNPSSFEDFKNDVFVGTDQSFIDSDANETSASLNLSNVGNAAFISNGYNTFIPNVNLPDYGPNHPVSQAVMNYNPWIYYAFVGANNTSLAHFHLTAKEQDAGDGYRKAVGAIGEGLFVSRLTSIPTSPPANLFVAKMLGRIHIDALVVRNIPFVGGTGYEIAINHTDIYGNYQQTRMHHPDGLTAGPIKETTIAYEVKTLNAQANTPESLYKMFKEGVNQVRHRANIPYMSAAVLVFDDKAWDKLRNFSYGTQAIDDIASMSSVTNQDGEQKIYFRIEKGLSQDANRAFFGLKDRIKNL